MNISLVDMSHANCQQADADYFTKDESRQISYAVAVKRCLQTVCDENFAIQLLNKYEELLIEGMDEGHLPSVCASAISMVFRRERRL